MVHPALAGGPPTMFYCGNDAAASPDSGAAGTVLDARGSSDHLPVWAVATLDN